MRPGIETLSSPESPLAEVPPQFIVHAHTLPSSSQVTGAAPCKIIPIEVCACFRSS